MSDLPSPQPHRVLRTLLVPYGAGALPVAAALVARHDMDLEAIFALWAFAGVAIGGITAALASAIVWRVDRAQLRAPEPLQWLFVAALLTVVAHWAPMGLALPVAVYRVAAEDAHLRTVFVALVPWWVSSGAGLAAWAAERPLRRRQADPGASTRAYAWARGLPMVWLLATLYGASATLPAFGWLTWTGTVGWERGVEGLALTAWSALGLGMAAVIPGAYGPLQRRSALVGAGAGRLHLAGLTLIAHWAVWFAGGLLREVFADPDAQHLVLWVSFGWIVLGTWVASVGAALGTRASGSRGSTGARAAG